LGSDPLSETDLVGNVINTYVFFNGQRVARNDSTPAVHYYFSDHLGSHGVVVNATASACEQDIDYYPYGGVENDYCPNTPQNYKFTGKERDAESGNDYFGARYYGSGIGRFLSSDALSWTHWQRGNKNDQGKFASYVANPQNFNLYAYVLNNPLNKTDPTGMYQCNANPAQCTAVKAALDTIRDAAANLQAGTSGKALLDKVLQFYGAENTNNGVQINFNNANVNALGSTSTANGVTTISFGANALAPLGPTGKAETVAHEGTHGVDEQKAGHNAQTFWQFYDTEYHAYQAESAVDKGLGTANETDEHPAWFPGITPQQRTTNITKDAYSNACFDVGGCQ
jgi:RHS repeat-associated protein